MLEDARTAVKAGDLARARELLTEYFKVEPKNPDAWLWMSAAVTTETERRACLKRALAIDPKNKAAILGLRLMGEQVGAPLHLYRVEPVIVKENHLQKFLDEKLPALLATAKQKPLLYGFTGFLLIAVFVIAVYGLLRPRNQDSGNDIVRWATPLPTATYTPVPTPTYIGPPPLWTRLVATFTPTPMFVATPHNRLEAYTAGMKAYEQQNWPKVVDYLNQVLNSEPNSPDVLYHLGDAYRFMKQYDQAAEAFNKAIGVDSSFAPAYLGLGRVYIEQNPPDLNQAQIELEQSVVLNPSLYESYYELAHIALINNNPELALNWLSRLDGLMPETALGDYYFAYAYMQQGNAPVALTYIQNANKLDVTLLSAYLLWGQILLENGDYQASLDPTTTYLTYAPADPRGFMTLATDYYHLGQYDPAKAALTTVIETHPEILAAPIMRGEIYMIAQDYPAALADFETALAIDDKSFDAGLGRGRALLANDNAGSAFMQFDRMGKWTATDPQKAELVYWRAVSLSALGETKAAIIGFETYLAYPEELVKPEQRADAESRYQLLLAPTPTPTP